MKKIEINRKTDILLAILLIIYLVVGGIFHILGDPHNLIANFAFLFFVLIHGVLRYGIKNLVVFFIITFAISWTTETLSIVYGFPFGNYHYTAILGFKLGPVPIMIMIAYFVAGYLAWTLSSTFLGNYGKGIEKKNVFFVPFIASFIMVMWNFCFDPIMSTIQGSWIWEDGGYYFGVPVSNYFGWFFTVYLIYQVYALYLYKFVPNKELGGNKLFWYFPAICYFGLALEYLIGPFNHTANLDIYWSMFLAAVFTMVFTAVLNLILVQRAKID
jgi:uncharacterized membrane protein